MNFVLIVSLCSNIFCESYKDIQTYEMETYSQCIETAKNVVELYEMMTQRARVECKKSK